MDNGIVEWQERQETNDSVSFCEKENHYHGFPTASKFSIHAVNLSQISRQILWGSTENRLYIGKTDPRR